MNTTATKLWNRHFIIFAIGWEFSLIGQTLLRFALPLYILRQTGDPALMGTVLGFSALSYLILSPVSGFVADRYSKRKLLGLLNLATAVAIFMYLPLSGVLSITPTTIIIMLLFVALECLISPTVEASVPVLVPEGSLIKANSITFLMTTFSAVGAPILGGFILGRFGLVPIIYISIGLYLLAALAQYSAKIPFEKRPFTGGIIKTLYRDLMAGLKYVAKENKQLGKVLVIIALFCLTLTPVMTIALPVLISLYFQGGETTIGLMQGIVVFGGTVGIFLLNALGDKINMSKIRTLLLIASFSLIPVIVSFLVNERGIISYVVLIGAFFIVIGSLSIIGLICWSYIGEKAPEHLMGKIMSLTLALMAVATAVGEFLYGLVFDAFIETPAIALAIIFVGAVIVAMWAKLKEEN